MDEPQLHVFHEDERDELSEEERAALAKKHSPATAMENISKRVQEKYAEKMAAAGPLRRAFLKMRMHNELETELEKHARTWAGRL